MVIWHPSADGLHSASQTHFLLLSAVVKIQFKCSLTTHLSSLWWPQLHIHPPLLGLQNFSMPCLMRTMRDSSVNDSMTLKLHSGLTSKKVMPFFSAYALACSVGTCRLKARCKRLPTRIRGTPGACWEKKKVRWCLNWIIGAFCNFKSLKVKRGFAS